MKICTKCGEQKQLNQFYKRSSRGTYHAECKSCYIERNTSNIRKKKIMAIEYLGNKCFDCNHQYHPAVYDFHHLDESTKEAEWKDIQNKSFEKIKLELDKCVLLCSNCHRLRHTKEELWKF